MYEMTETQIAERAAYVQWRREWRARYADLSLRIRTDKIVCKQDQRRCGGASVHQSPLAEARKAASRMMAERTEVDQARRAMPETHAKAA